MTKEFEQALRMRRVKKSVEIFSNPEKFKVCDQCLSICTKSAAFCPLCHAYRWQEDPLDVKATALVACQSAVPITSGTVPRF